MICDAPNLKSALRSWIVLVSILSTTSSVKIEKILVPEVIQAGNSSGAYLECVFSGVSDEFVLQWLVNGSEMPVYQWSPKIREPQVSGVFDGRIDVSYEPPGPPSLAPSIGRRVLKITSLDPELSGEYTCRVLDRGTEASLSKSMLVYSSEKEFTLEFYRQLREVDIKCTAKGLYPEPELILERNGVIFQRQQLRMWRTQGLLFDAESTTSLPIPALGFFKPEQITCRLHIPAAGYSAMRMELLYIDKECSNNSADGTADSILKIFLTVMAMKLF